MGSALASAIICVARKSRCGVGTVLFHADQDLTTTVLAQKVHLDRCGVINDI